MGFSRQEYWSGLPLPSPVHESEKCLPVPNKPEHELLNWAVSLIRIGLEDTPPTLWKYIENMVIHCSIVISQCWKQLNCPYMGEWLNKLWHVHTTEQYSCITRNELSWCRMLSRTFCLFCCFRLFFVIFWLLSVACGILVPWTGIKPAPPALEAQSLNH